MAWLLAIESLHRSAGGDRCRRDPVLLVTTDIKYGKGSAGVVKFSTLPAFFPLTVSVCYWPFFFPPPGQVGRRAASGDARVPRPSTRAHLATKQRCFTLRTFYTLYSSHSQR